MPDRRAPACFSCRCAPVFIALVLACTRFGYHNPIGIPSGIRYVTLVRFCLLVLRSTITFLPASCQYRRLMLKKLLSVLQHHDFRSPVLAYQIARSTRSLPGGSFCLFSRICNTGLISQAREISSFRQVNTGQGRLHSRQCRRWLPNSDSGHIPGVYQQRWL